MKQTLLTGLLSMTTLGMAIAAPAPRTWVRTGMVDKVAVKSIKNQKAEYVKKPAPGVSISVNNGVKKLHTLKAINDSPAKIMKKAPRNAESTLPEGYVLFESFEGWDGEDPEWTPDGWTVDMRGNVERKDSWTPCAQAPMLPAPADGTFYYGINYSTGQQDEWLISPEVEVIEGMSLSYWLYLDPTFLFSLENVNWDTLEFIGDKVVAATLQIWVQPEGGEWTMLHDYADDYADLGLMDIMMLTPSAMEKKTESLAEYAGKKVKVAMRYVGTDGNSMFIDAVGIGYPALDEISYMDPFSTLYWGFERDWNLPCINTAVAHQPVYAPLTWTNTSGIDGVTFSWEYCDPVTADFVTDDDQEMLTVTYVPDYSTDSSKKNNIFYPPTLKATAPNTIPGSYTAPYAYFQAGGKAELTLNDGSEFKPALIPFLFRNLGLAKVTVDDPEIGDLAIPVFGHNANTNQYWLNYSLNGEEARDGDYSHLEGIANLFFASEAPLVVNGMTVYGFGQVDPDAEFTATIYGLDADMSSDITTFTEIAKTTVTGADIIAEDAGTLGNIVIPFDFDSPVVVKATEEHPAYVFMFSGFNSDKVEYFVPFQSKDPDPNYMCLGYILNHIDLSNHTERPEYYSFKPMVYKENGDYVDLYGAFAIGIEGEYPWLTTECEGITLGSDGMKVEVPLGSYYDGSQLSVEVPAGVEATVAGRYDECVLTVAHNAAEVIVDGDIVVKGPGVEVTIPVKEGSVGVGSVVDNSATVAGIYNLNGKRVASAENGVYIIKYSDGSVRKIVK